MNPILAILCVKWAQMAPFWGSRGVQNQFLGPKPTQDPMNNVFEQKNSWGKIFRTPGTPDRKKFRTWPGPARPGRRGAQRQGRMVNRNLVNRLGTPQLIVRLWGCRLIAINRILVNRSRLPINRLSVKSLRHSMTLFSCRNVTGLVSFCQEGWHSCASFAMQTVSHAISNLNGKNQQQH